MQLFFAAISPLACLSFCSQFIALRTSSLEKSKTYFQNLGMKVQSVKGGKRINTKASILTSNSIFENEDATEPEREVSS